MERWKGSPETTPTKLHTVSSRASVLDPGSSLLETTTQPRNKAPPDHKTVSSRPANRDPVPRGGKVRLPQRPEVSPKQATPLPLPNRLRQPLKKQDMGKQPALKQISPYYIPRHHGQRPGIQSFGNNHPALKQSQPNYILRHHGLRAVIQSFKAQKQAPDPIATAPTTPIRACYPRKSA